MSNSEEPDIMETPQKEAMEREESVHTDFKDTDIDLKTVKKFVIGSFAVTLAVFVLMLVVHRFYKKAFTSDRGVAKAEERQIPGKDDALLQTEPLEDRQAYFDGEEEKLTMTTNAVEHAVIPVESAKKLMLENKAFPTPKPKSEEMAGLSPMVAPPSASGTSQKNAGKETADMESSMASAPSGVASDSASSEKGETQLASSSPRMVPKYPNPPDPQMVAMGKKIWDVQCMAACHTGKRGAIGPNIHKAFGTMRKLENHEPILMDKSYVVNSMNNPMEHIAKGYMPVMMSFKETLSDKEKNAVAEYLRSQGKEIMVPAPEEKKPAQMAAAPSSEEKKAEDKTVPAEEEVSEMTQPAEKTEEQAPAEPMPSPEPAVTPEPATPQPAPAAPAPTPAPAPGPIFV